MPLAARILACLDVRGGRVVKGTRFVDLRDAGDPVELAMRYAEAGADEIVILDGGSSDGTAEPLRSVNVGDLTTIFSSGTPGVDGRRAAP